MTKVWKIFLCLSISLSSWSQSQFDSTVLKHVKTFGDNITPKSIVYGGHGVFFAQNMMYRHTVTVYDENGELLQTIKDTLDLSRFDCGRSGIVKGSPVEAALSADQKYMWVSNYQMYGDGFNNPGCDACSDTTFDPSFLYAINTSTFLVDHIVEVGSVPKFIAASSDGKWVAVSNWTSGDVTVIDQSLGEVVKTIPVGRYPRGLAFDESKECLYVALMGADAIAQIDLITFGVQIYSDFGDGPRHLIFKDSCLYVTLNSEKSVVKWDLIHDVKTFVKVGYQPRSMTISDDNEYLYVVNYKSNSLTKIRVRDMMVVQNIKTNAKPIGVTFDPVNKRVWVACYGGSILVYQEEAPQAIEELYYHIVVASFGSESKAIRMSKQLQEKGYDSEVKSGDGRFRVIIEKEKSNRKAQKNLAKHREVYPNAWLLKG